MHAKLLSRYFRTFPKFKDLSNNDNFDELLNIDGIENYKLDKKFFSNKTNTKVLRIKKVLYVNNTEVKKILDH